MWKCHHRKRIPITAINFVTVIPLCFQQSKSNQLNHRLTQLYIRELDSNPEDMSVFLEEAHRNLLYSIPGRTKLFTSSLKRPDRPCGPAGLLFNGNEGFYPGGKLAKTRSSLLVSSREVKNVWCYGTIPVCSFMASTGTTVPTLHYDGEIGYIEDSSVCSNKLFNQLYFAQPPPCFCKTDFYYCHTVYV